MNSIPNRTATAIVAAAMLDLVLTEALRVHLHQSTEITKNLFAMSGPLGDLAPKLDLAFLVGLVSDDTWRDLVTVKDIRNRFAHKLDISDFKSEAIAALSRNLKIAKIRTFDADVELKEFPKGC